MERKLIQLSDVITDIAAGPFGSNLKVSCFVNDGFPIIDGANLRSFKVTDNITKFVTEEKARSLHRSIAKRGDIVVTISGTLGQIAYIPEDSKYEEYLCSQRQFRVTFDTTKVYVPYLAFYFHTYEGQHKILSFANQVGVPALSQPLKNFRRITIQLPDIDTQKKIAIFVELINEKIEQNESINNNLEQQAVLLFKKWFIEFDNSSKNMLETRFGLVPESFKLLKNGELPLVVTDYVANGSFASLKANVTLYQEPNYAYFIRNTDLKSGTFEVFVDEHSYNFLSKSTLHGGEIIISNVGDVGSVFLCPKLDKPMTLGNNIIMLRPEQENLRYYLYIWFKWLYGQSLIQGIKGGSAQPKFNKTDFKNLPIFLPPDDLLEQFHQIVKPIFELINENNTENQALTRTRDTILPRLMSGELDVSDIDL